MIGRQVTFQLHTHAAVSASHIDPAAVDTGHRASQPQAVQVVAHRPRKLGTWAGQEFVHEFGGQQIGIVDGHIPRIGHHGAARRVGEIDGVPAIGGLELPPVEQYPIGQRIDPPFTVGLHQGELRVLNVTLSGLEDPDVRQGAQLVGAHVDRPTIDTTLVGEHRRLNQYGSARVIPSPRTGFGKELAGRPMPIGRVSGRLQEFAQHRFGLHTRCGCGHPRRRRALHCADRLRRGR
ncbi:Uncharacterised protein [Mycobacteroides abscessus subsp. massiliense]|nr:Uncharacterised protein [Mycobacteroides abscessus subsp. massiliense]